MFSDFGVSETNYHLYYYIIAECFIYREYISAYPLEKDTWKVAAFLEFITRRQPPSGNKL